jgi:hypothetical protein
MFGRYLRLPLIVGVLAVGLSAAFPGTGLGRGGPYQYQIHAHVLFGTGALSGATVQVHDSHDSSNDTSCLTDGSGNCTAYINETAGGLSFSVYAWKCIGTGLYESGTQNTSGYDWSGTFSVTRTGFTCAALAPVARS